MRSNGSSDLYKATARTLLRLELQGSNGSGDPYRATTRTLLQLLSTFRMAANTPQSTVGQWWTAVNASLATIVATVRHHSNDSSEGEVGLASNA